MTVLTIDIGSSSVRAILFDEHKNSIESNIVSRKYSFDVTAEGGSTVNNNFLRGLVAVSYTHLDVYKRQSL